MNSHIYNLQERTECTKAEPKQRLWVINYEIPNISKGTAIVKANNANNAGNILMGDSQFNSYKNNFNISRIEEITADGAYEHLISEEFVQIPNQNTPTEPSEPVDVESILLNNIEDFCLLQFSREEAIYKSIENTEYITSNPKDILYYTLSNSFICEKLTETPYNFDIFATKGNYQEISDASAPPQANLQLCFYEYLPGNEGKFCYIDTYNRRVYINIIPKDPAYTANFSSSLFYNTQNGKYYKNTYRGILNEYTPSKLYSNKFKLGTIISDEFYAESENKSKKFLNLSDNKIYKWNNGVLVESV